MEGKKGMKMKCTHGKEESVRERGRGGREDQEMLLSQDFDWVYHRTWHWQLVGLSGSNYSSFHGFCFFFALLLFWAFTSASH